MSTHFHQSGDHLQLALDHARHLLPSQGPIGVFVHHNTLHSFQDIPFEEAVITAAKLYGAEPFLPETDYIAAYKAGRIHKNDIDYVLATDLKSNGAAAGLDVSMLRSQMLVPGVTRFDVSNLRWLRDERRFAKTIRSDIDEQTREKVCEGRPEEVAAARLILTIQEKLRVVPDSVLTFPADTTPGLRLRYSTAAITERKAHIDITTKTLPLLVRLSGCFIDQGVAYWPMTGREDGFFKASLNILAKPGVAPDGLQNLRSLAAAVLQRGVDATEYIKTHIKALGIPDNCIETWITDTLLELPGWAGMFNMLEHQPNLAPYVVLNARLIDFVAVKLLIECSALESLYRSENVPSFTSDDFAVADDVVVSAEIAVIQIFDACQLIGFGASVLQSLTASEFAELVAAVLAFHPWERRRIWHLAYERRHLHTVLTPLSLIAAEHIPAAQRPQRPIQVMFCIDEREESMRRALEASDFGIETVGAAGFFGVAVSYAGLDDHAAADLCPVIVTPQHAVREVAADSDSLVAKARLSRRRMVSNVIRQYSIGSRTLIRAWIGTAGLGVLAIIPLVTRVLAPSLTLRLYRALNERLLPVPRTEMLFENTSDAAHDKAEGLANGFNVQERADRVLGLLRSSGIIDRLSPLVVLMGHGATTVNNPHESAYDCGACGGRRGGPNARIFAMMANQPAVRHRLVEMGHPIPNGTWFLAGCHDTTTDDCQFFDVERLPETHRALYDQLVSSCREAGADNALERIRRFELASGITTPDVARRHVRERSEHLSEARPEYGHATNAVAIFGRRSLTESLYMDRRAFLISYDASTDPSSQIITGHLGAAGLVCAGISLEYYFSTVDNEVYGCGTKLPHNIAGLVGVMNGQSGDLRTGLPKQTVEVHEPVRVLLVIEAKPAAVEHAMSQHAEVNQIIRNEWVRIATIDPDSGSIHFYSHGTFHPYIPEHGRLPTVNNSREWYAGHMGHLPYAKLIKQVQEQHA